MSNFPPDPPPEQQAIRAGCVHPAASFVEFEKADIEQSIPDRFEEIVRKYPDRLALKTPHCALTYDELNRAANRVATAILSRRGEKPEPVGLLLEDPAQAIAAILGALKAGKFYVPLDRSSPPARIASILLDSGAGLLVTDGANSRVGAELTGRRLDQIGVDELSGGSGENLGLTVTPEDTACIIYTSGSTGQPKGVVQNHRCLLHWAMIHTNHLGIARDDRLSLLHSWSVAACIHHLFGSLLNGASLFPLDARLAGGGQLARWLTQEEITIYHSVPMVFRQLAVALSDDDSLHRLRAIILSGAPMIGNDLELYKSRFPSSCVLLHLIGTTETGNVSSWTIDKTTRIVGAAVPIGYAMVDVEVVLLDDDRHEVAKGEIGEIAVKSRYLASGYWQKPELTRARFLLSSNEAEERIYLTGDLARMQPDGCLFHLGRKDFQVNVRGYRVETAEVERALREHDTVKEAVVIGVKAPAGDAQVVAYFVPNRGEAPSAGKLHSFLRARLPDYMIPSSFVALDALPLTPNGKLDYGALPAPQPVRPELEAAYVAPESTIEQRIASVWQEILGLEKCGLHDNFFDLGGNSLLLVQLHGKLQQLFDKEIAIVEMFGHPTISTVAKYLTGAPAEPVSSRPPAESAQSIRRSNNQPNDRAAFEIAIVGMAGRFPGAKDIEEFWQNIRSGVESITFFTDEELAAAGIERDVLNNPNYVKAWGVLANAECFDAPFFGFSPREAEIMDPQHRLFLECAWQALENAGYEAQTFAGSIGVYAGASMNTYLLHNMAAWGDILRSEAGLQIILGSDKDYLATRVSYKMNLTGPSVSVQTSCSTSLVAVHMACQSLLGGECDMALAGGVAVRVPQTAGYLYQEGHILSPDGHCRAFDAGAKGTVWSSGVGVVVLKRIEEALAHGDHIYAVIKGTAINNDGVSKIGYSAPSIDGQAQMMVTALANANVAPETLGYIEAHGTGTSLGDPIEIAGLTQAFRASNAPVPSARSRPTLGTWEPPPALRDSSKPLWR
jgi:amino acid adenylation domain-containing protein